MAEIVEVLVRRSGRRFFASAIGKRASSSGEPRHAVIALAHKIFEPGTRWRIKHFDRGRVPMLFELEVERSTGG